MEPAHSFKEQTDVLLDLLSTLDEDQLNQIPFSGSWTAAQVADHLYRSYEIEYLSNGKVNDSKRPADGQMPTINKIFLNFDEKYKSPPEIVPTDDFLDKKNLMKNLQERIAFIHEAALTMDLSLLCMESEFPYMGYLTRFEWIGFCAAHTLRHNRQIENILIK